MAAFYFNIGKRSPLMVVPETRVYMDGHPILTNSYSLYKDPAALDPAVILSQDDQLKQSDPNYLGYITFEVPGKVFNYIADGNGMLTRSEIEEAITQITYFRENPKMWKSVEN